MAAHWPAMKQRWLYVALMGGLGLAGFTSLFSLGAQHTTAVNLGITQGAILAFVVLFGLLVFGTPVGKLQFLGLLLSLCGVVMLVTGDHFAMLLTLQFNLGDLLMIAACFCYAFYVQHLGKRLDMPPSDCWCRAFPAWPLSSIALFFRRFFRRHFLCGALN